MIVSIETKQSSSSRLTGFLVAATLVLRDIAVVALAATYDWQARQRERRQLASLDDAVLKDLGLTRVDVEREIRKPFWHA